MSNIQKYKYYYQILEGDIINKYRNRKGQFVTLEEYKKELQTVCDMMEESMNNSIGFKKFVNVVKR